MFLKTFFLYVLDNLNITYSVAAALITSVPNPFFFFLIKDSLFLVLKRCF